MAPHVPSRPAASPPPPPPVIVEPPFGDAVIPPPAELGAQGAPPAAPAPEPPTEQPRSNPPAQVTKSPEPKGKPEPDKPSSYKLRFGVAPYTAVALGQTPSYALGPTQSRPGDGSALSNDQFNGIITSVPTLRRPTWIGGELLVEAEYDSPTGKPWRLTLAAGGAYGVGGSDTVDINHSATGTGWSDSAKGQAQVSSTAWDVHVRGEVGKTVILLPHEWQGILFGGLGVGRSSYTTTYGSDVTRDRKNSTGLSYQQDVMASVQQEMTALYVDFRLGAEARKVIGAKYLHAIAGQLFFSLAASGSPSGSASSSSTIHTVKATNPNGSSAPLSPDSVGSGQTNVSAGGAGGLSVGVLFKFIL